MARFQEGALSAKRTPTTPPTAANLVPIAARNEGVRIVSDGLPTGTYVTLNGVLLPDVTAVSWEIKGLGHLATATIVVECIAVDLVASEKRTSLEERASEEFPNQQEPPPLEPDPELIGHAEGNRFTRRLYRWAAEKMRREARHAT